MNHKFLIACVVLVVTNLASCSYGFKIAYNNKQLFEDNQIYTEELKTLRKACVAFKNRAEKSELKLDLIKQELKEVDFDYIQTMPGGMDLKVQIINQTIGEE